mmetsp:Transcript_51570/g.161776  ORF Transcript_51570/g.161776 Transcript_51570/m.161776 type:complete len:162 (-) Transcript_51570:9-494(-)
MEPIEDMLMMLPLRFLRITGRTCLHTNSMPVVLTQVILSNTSRLTSERSDVSPSAIPTLLCRMSIVPNLHGGLGGHVCLQRRRLRPKGATLSGRLLATGKVPVDAADPGALPGEGQGGGAPVPQRGSRLLPGADHQSGLAGEHATGRLRKPRCLLRWYRLI